MKQRVSARVRANRRNAQLSTGPRTADGKARSSRNATTHGLSRGTMAVVPAKAIDQLAREIAGPAAGPLRLELARSVAGALAEKQVYRRMRLTVMMECLTGSCGGPVVMRRASAGLFSTSEPALRGKPNAARRIAGSSWLEYYFRSLRALLAYERRADRRLRHALKTLAQFSGDNRQNEPNVSYLSD